MSPSIFAERLRMTLALRDLTQTVFGEKVAQDHSSSRGIGAYAFAYVSTYGLLVIFAVWAVVLVPLALLAVIFRRS